jgi:taurine transport system permease protein|tara:strand:+ start:1827 stop:3719 length:1893 start_codon:yes stop_codon:yes gene_type:complete
MVTGIASILILLTLIGSIVYGRKKIKSERIDAVFGNPERSEGGYHWIIAGTCTILLLWLYFSWDIVKSFYPNSANELCQVAKVRESLLGLKYSFPIEERTHKNTAVIKRETQIIENFRPAIQNSKMKDEDKNKLLYLLGEFELMIVSLTEEKNLDPNVKLKVKNVANKILRLADDFEQDIFLLKESLEDKNKRNELLKKQTTWGETGMEIPPVPESNTGLKFHLAAKELNLISDEFFQIKNENPVYLEKLKNINDQIKNFKDELNENQEIEKEYIGKIERIPGRISRGYIFPPKLLDDVEKALIEFDKVQKKEQGSLAIIDNLLFPTGTIIYGGDVCSETGSGRWLPKASDTLKVFFITAKPSEGYKNVPLFWYQMLGINKIVDFIIPDWIADIIPGKYSTHSSDGKIRSNFKSKVFSIVSGDFKSFSIPVPSGHIWDSFLRVLLGLIFGIVAGVPLGLFMGLSRFAKGYFDPVIELYRPVPPLAWAPLIITIFGIDNSGKIFLLFMVAFAIMIVSARAGASGTQLSKIHAAHSLGASKWQILRQVIFPNSLPEILTGIRVAIGVSWGTLVAAEFLAGTTGIGFVENVASKFMQYEIIWISIFIMGLLGLLFDIGMRKIIEKTIPWRGKG